MTYQNPGGDPQKKSFTTFQSCNIKDFPSNIDVAGKQIFDGVGIVKYVNCQTPEEFNNVNYDFSKHTFVNGGSAIELINTAILKNINLVGAEIKRDPFSILAGTNYDNSGTGIPANTLQDAIDYLHGLISNS